ncbi:MAG: hypothetical protein ACK40Y_09490 [Cloacibacterium caeni]
MKKKYLLFFILAIISCSRDSTDTKKDVPVVKKTGVLTFESLTLIKERLVFNTNALGRETIKGTNNGQKIELFDTGLAHPSVIYIPEGINGYKYWCALTPYFGIINAQPDKNAFENPHVFCSNDGLSWSEPKGAINPIDNANLGKYLNYWSDTNLCYENGKLHLYYRGNYFDRNFFGDKGVYARAVVERNSSDGIHWTDRKILYASNTITKGIDDNSIIASPSFIEDKGKWYCYDVVYSTVKNPYPPQGNQTTAFVFRRVDTVPDGTFGTYSAENICSFDSRPWGETFDPWHIEVVKYDNKFFMLINAGLVGLSNGQSLWLAYSSDGKNFKVLPNPLFKENTYKSSLLPISTNDKFITFMLYQSDKRDGSINAYKLTLKKI